MRRAALAAALLLAAPTAHAQDSRYHCPKLGTVTQYVFGAVVGPSFRLESADGPECTWRNLANNKTWTDHALFVTVKPLADEGFGPEEQRAIEDVWRLQAGQSSEFTINRAGHRYHYTFTAIGPENLALEKATYPTWHIRLALQLIPLTQGAVYDYWWSETLGVTVQRKFHTEGNRWENTPADYELMAIKTP